MTAPASSEVLLVDDDPTFRGILARALSRRGFRVREADGLSAARQAAAEAPPDLAVVDLKLPDGSGLDVIGALHAASKSTRILVLTGYASIATAVEAVKLGASNYLAKPATADEILRALGQTASATEVPIAEAPPTVARLEWEYIQRVLAEHGGNVSATARALRMHRRTLQRKLARRPVRD